MIKIVNKFFPPKGFIAMTIFPFIFVRKGKKFDAIDENHENIHGRQQDETNYVSFGLMGFLFGLGCGWWSLLALPLYFYWYGIEYVIRLMQYLNLHKAYRNIAFEREAYDNENILYYLMKGQRKPFAWVKYLFKSTTK